MSEVFAPDFMVKPPLVPNSLPNKQECCVISCIYRICVGVCVCGNSVVASVLCLMAFL